MKARAHVIISGIVQGVNFRYYTKLKAKENKVTGWIRNLVDGRVEAVFEGEKSSVESMIEFCKRGPPNAYVSNVEVKWEDFRGESEIFEIRY
ncbi:MAG: acylphosphatase [Candidatus Aenigmatarchaeota archaeon]